jgi:flagellar M-ring protein FliF
MNQLAKIWTSLTRSQQVSLILVPIVVCAAVFGLLRWKHDSSFRILYSALAAEDAAAVTQKIREAGIEFRLDETGATVSVPADRLPDARLAVAGAGLPKSGRIGFELFDRTNLGASDFAEQVNYRRALEGELERTVATLSEIDQARIHITFAKESVFLDARQPSTGDCSAGRAFRATVKPNSLRRIWTTGGKWNRNYSRRSTPRWDPYSDRIDSAPA